jgi:hypothetical protein
MGHLDHCNAEFRQLVFCAAMPVVAQPHTEKLRHKSLTKGRSAARGSICDPAFSLTSDDKVILPEVRFSEAEAEHVAVRRCRMNLRLLGRLDDD